MSSNLALLIWFVMLLALLRFDPARERNTSIALWIPIIWIFFIASRLPSQWLGDGNGDMATAFAEGNSLDRGFYIIMMMLALGILISRSIGWTRIIFANMALTIMLSFSLLSVLWSDFPFIAFKRWIRDLGVYMVILVALSDPHPFEAVRNMLRRIYFLLIPLCILLIKYFPELSKEYEYWTGSAQFIGATTSKNMLGVLCLASGLYFFWDILTRWRDRKDSKTKLILAIDVSLFAMTLYLLKMAGSATSNVCFIIGCAVIAVAHSSVVKRKPALLTVMIPVGMVLYLLLEFVFSISIIALVSEAVGRNPDLTGRTDIWNALLGMNTNPFVGTGYESFWLGERLRSLWELFNGINQAHNGYLEVYINLGAIGFVLLAGFLIGSYRAICRKIKISPSLGSLGLAFWTVLLFYNVTEAAFKIHLMWVVFVVEVIVVPERGNGFSKESELMKGSTRKGNVLPFQ